MQIILVGSLHFSVGQLNQDADDNKSTTCCCSGVFVVS